MSRILITGCNGQLGTDCVAELGADHTILATDLPDMDITSYDTVMMAIKGFRPEILVNCAAYTAVDAAESDPQTCDLVNHEAPKLLAQICAEKDIFLVHVSTDYVFDGRREPPEPWLETDIPNPATVYGNTKHLGEISIEQSGCRHAIFRTAWLYGATGKNFPKTMLRLALEDAMRKIKVVDDQFGCPTWSRRLAQQIKRFLSEDNPPKGTFHAAAQDSGTWYEFAKTFLDLMQVPHSVVPCTSADYPTPAQRPRNSILENRNLESVGMNIMDDWRTALAEYVATHRDALIAEAQETIAAK